MAVPSDALFWTGITNVRLPIPYMRLAQAHNALHRGNHLLSMNVASVVPIATNYCRVWYTWRLVASQIMLAAVEATLILRGQWQPCSPMSS
jgi:hypothetical protein